MDASPPAPDPLLLPPVITGPVPLLVLVVPRSVGPVLFSRHRRKGRNISADSPTPGEAIASRLAHIGEELFRRTGRAAAPVLAATGRWALTVHVVGRQG
ncbi:hypothetical protein SNE510_07490 [Streptomyces sp. NE5-10]|uniref:hypothetical protein n=1 Tax=Streptomyces sp. NE5-10 TaxID=2759674 RepID=UPI00190546AB|nr:hypothetical protein [Streptomyces sp. NE5-10]GHJ91230.1 hypothetical protein SNE510_07490 [Streptomyces sp. NE5-10]